MRHFIRAGLVYMFTIFLVRSLMASGIIPAPLKTELLEGFYVLGSVPAYYSSDQCRNEARLMAGYLEKQFGTSPRKATKRKADIRLIIDANKDKEANPEAYSLQITERGIDIIAASPAGIFYGIQSLMQLLRDEKKVAGIRKLACQRITDEPRFAWRAFLLDEARHFKGTRVVKQLLDEMAALKMNRFQWHLTDDQGWRIEIEKYPLLTTVGSVRKYTQTGGIGSTTFDSTVHKGYYTKEQIEDIVQYAAERHIQVIPEIEMPGHATAAIAAYPWLSVTGKKIEVATTFGVFEDVFNVADPKVVGFLQDVLDEVATMFPSKIIHIGGDEVKYDQWKNSAAVAAFMKKNDLSSPADLQLWFTNSMSAYLSKKQLRMMGWNDITGSQLHEYNDAGDAPLNRKLASNTIVHFWKGDPALVS